MQFQAGYILASVRDALIDYSKGHGKGPELGGMFRSLSTFEVQTECNLETPLDPPSILAVASNILTRGMPSLASVFLEEYFATQLGETIRQDKSAHGKVEFPFVDVTESNKYGQTEKEILNRQRALFKTLHTIDPRAKDRRKYLNVSDVDSNFERAFF